MFRKNRGGETVFNGCGIGAGAVILLVLIVTLLLSFYTVKTGEIGIITRFGAVQYTVSPGLGVKWPFIDGIVKLNIQTQKDEVDASAASSNLQSVTAKIAVNYRLDPLYALEVFRSVGSDYSAKVVTPSIQNVFKETTAKFTATQLITDRDKVRVLAEKTLTERLAVYHVIVDNFNITNFDFSPEFNASNEKKAVAEQEVETAKQRLEQAKVDAQTALTVAQGQANSQKAVRDAGALTPEYLQYLFLQKWNGVLPQVTGGAVPTIDTNKYLSGK